MIKPTSSNATGLFFVAAAIGLGLVSLLRYSADASASFAATLPEASNIEASSLRISSTKTGASGELQEDFMSALEPDGRYRFSMDIVGASSSYAVFSLDVVAQGTDAEVTLRVQKKRGGPIKEYEKSLNEESFRPFWHSLRMLEVAQLTNLSPQTESFALSLDNPDSKRSDFDSWKQTGTVLAQPTVNVPKLELATTYRFTFQDGIYDYPNSFEVYAPDALVDTRYQHLKDLAHRFAEETFGTL